MTQARTDIGWLLLLAFAVGCSAEGKTYLGRAPEAEPRPVPSGATAAVGGTGWATGGSGAISVMTPATSNALAGTGGPALFGQDPLTAHIEKPDRLTIELVTLQCAGDCFELQVVAHGGNPPYAIEWNDGSDSAARTLCPEASATFLARVTDTPIAAVEFPYEGQTASANVSAQVLGCNDAGAPDAGVLDAGSPDAGAPPLTLCASGTTPPFLLIEKAPSQSTTAFTEMNGTLADYNCAGSPLSVVGGWRRQIDRGACTKLLLAGDATGTKPIGWDNALIVEYLQPGGPVIKRWYYGSEVSIVYEPTGETLSLPLAPSVLGPEIDPAILFPAPFGYPACTIDLMATLPAGVKQFELRLYVVDYGIQGSTSDIWVIPE